jgi:hypothetical protein
VLFLVMVYGDNMMMRGNIMYSIASKVDDYLCNKSVELMFLECNHFRLLQMKILLTAQILLHKVYPQLELKDD